MSTARALLLTAALIAAPAAAQNFPSKLIRIVTASPGSTRSAVVETSIGRGVSDTSQRSI